MTTDVSSGSSEGPAPAATSLPDDLLTITIRRVPPDMLVLAARGDVDISTSRHLQHVLLAHLNAAAPQVTVDLSGVGFLSAAGLTALVNGREAADAAGIDLCLVAGTRVVLRPLTITGLDGVFDIYPELTDALPAPADGTDG